MNKNGKDWMWVHPSGLLMWGRHFGDEIRIDGYEDVLNYRNMWE